MKYVKAGDPAPTPDALAKIKAEAIDQLDQYSASRDLVTEWRLKEGTGNGERGTGLWNYIGLCSSSTAEIAS